MDIPVPLYYKLKEDLIRMIENNLVKPDELIPSERELIDQYSMSRTTVRKALDILTNEGYLYKVQGKGTYVKGKKFTQGLIKLSSCTEDLKNRGLTPNVKVINKVVELPTKSVSTNLSLKENEKVYFMERVVAAEGYPINRTKSYIPYNIFKGIEEYDFTKESLYNTMETKYNIQIAHANRTIEAVLADKQLARLLEVDEGFPILLFRGVVFGEVNGVQIPIEYFESKYRSDRSKFHIEQIR
jgi:GntR family transcriptional regulator